MTIQKYIHTSPRKLRLVAQMVRKMKPAVALETLRFTPKNAARDLSAAIETVLANAKQAGMSVDNLVFKNLEINESLKMKRHRAGTRGRVKPYKKRMSHIKIVLSDSASKSVDQSISVSEKSGQQANQSTDLPKGRLTETPKKRSRKVGK